MTRLRLLTFGLLVALLLAAGSGCGTTFQPQPIDEVPFRERAISQESDGIRVTAAVPSAKETRALFGSRLYKKGVQPVWIEIENGLDEEVSFLAVGLDPEYYTPIETAYLGESAKDAESGESVARYFFDSGMSLAIRAGETQSGFVFTPVDEGTKSFNVDVIGASGGHRFSFFVPVPGLKLDHQTIDWDARLASPAAFEITEVDKIIEALESLPCCATDEEGVGQADPLNIVVVGHPDDVYYAFMRAGWDETETINRTSMWKTAASFLTGGEYRYSPVSSLYALGRQQDVAFQKARENIHERNHLRLWMSNARWQGKPVWIGQISRDIGVRFSRRTITTHKIDPDTDETREFLLENLAYAQSISRAGYVNGAVPASMESPRHNLTGDPYFTDGRRIVLWVSPQPIAIPDINWRPNPFD
jgi:hypothetical protein